MRCGMALLGVLCGWAAVAQADVYWRQKHSTPAGWTRAYHVPADLTHGKGEVSVFSAEGDVPSVLDAIHELHGDSFAAFPGEEAAWGVAMPEGWLLRYFLQRHPKQDTVLVTRVAQKKKEAGAPGESPQRHQLRDLPAYAGSRPTYYLKDGGTQMAVEISTTSAPPAAVLSSMRSSMDAAGWTESLPGEGGLAWYMRKGALGLITAQRSPDGFTRVLRLHKPLGVK